VAKNKESQETTEKKRKLAIDWWNGLPKTYRKMLYEEITDFKYSEDEAFVRGYEVVDIAEKMNIFFNSNS
jgi:hypothetical protein